MQGNGHSYCLVSVNTKHGKKTIVRKKMIVIAGSTFDIPPASATTVRLVTTKAGRRAFSKAAKRALQGVLTMSVPGGKTVTTSVTIS